MITVATPQASALDQTAYTVSYRGGGVHVDDYILQGDLVQDSMLDMRDAYMLYRIASGDMELPEYKHDVADMNYDGAIDMRDAYLLYKIASGE